MNEIINRKIIVRNFQDLIDAFLPQKTPLILNGAKKKILIFNWRDLRHKYAGGAEIYIHELAKRWVKEGNSVTLFCGNDGVTKRQEIIDGVYVIRRGGFYLVYILALLYYFFKFKNEFDIMIDCQNGVPFFTPLYVKEKKYCLMFHVHQDVFKKSLPKPLAVFASFLENTCMPHVYKKIKFLTISQSTKKNMQELGLGKVGIEIVHPGVNTASLTPAKKSDHPTVLYLGRLKHYKSIHIFIQAAKILSTKIKNISFLIAGDGEEKVKLKRLVKKYNLQDSIQFLGKVTEDEKIKLYQQAWVFVNPSIMEGWGITTIEANACGTPVVASKVPGLIDSVKNPHTGYLVTYGDSNEFAIKIHGIVTNTQIRENMSRHAITWAQEFDWEKSAKQSLEIITGD